MHCIHGCRSTCLPLPPAGTPAKPTITQALGGTTLAAKIDFPRVFTAVDYAVELADVNNASVKVTDSLNVADTAAGPWSRTLTAPAKGTYRFKVGAVGG